MFGGGIELMVVKCKDQGRCCLTAFAIYTISASGCTILLWCFHRRATRRLSSLLRCSSDLLSSLFSFCISVMCYMDYVAPYSQDLAYDGYSTNGKAGTPTAQEKGGLAF
jgi:hypothetical protein